MKHVSGGTAADKVIIFVKAPIPGTVKTRLTPGFDAGQAAALYRCMVEDLLEQLDSLEGVALEIRFAPVCASSRVRRWLGARGMAAQCGPDLGARMDDAFRESFRTGSQRCVIVGSDIPELSADIVRRGLAILRTRDVVIGSCRDGGYYLIGLRQPCRGLFSGMSWSTDRVLEETLARLRRLGLRAGRLPRLADIDTPADVARLRRRLATRRGGLPRVRGWLRSVRSPRSA